MKIYSALLLAALAIAAASPAHAVPLKPIRAALKHIGIHSPAALSAAEKTLIRLVKTHGDDALPFVRATGQKGLQALDDAGEAGAKRLLALYRKHGANAGWIINHPRRLQAYLAHGDHAASALMKHPGLAEDVIGRYGAKGAEALEGLSTQEARRMTKLLVDDAGFAARPDATRFVEVIRQYGDPSMDFLWRHKGTILTGSVAAAFLNDPKPYIDGAKTLVVEPVTDTVQQVADKVAWNWIFIPVALVLFLAYGGVTALSRIRQQVIKARARPDAPPAAPPSP